MQHNFGSFGKNPHLRKSGIDLSLFPSVENTNAQVIQLAFRRSGKKEKGEEREKEKVMTGTERGDIIGAINTARSIDLKKSLDVEMQKRLNKLITENFEKNTSSIGMSKDTSKMMDSIMDAARGSPLKTSITEQRQSAELMRPFMDRLIRNMEEGTGQAIERSTRGQ